MMVMMMVMVMVMVIMGGKAITFPQS